MEIDFLKSSGIFRKRNRLVVYQFVDKYKKEFGLRWLCRHFGLSPNGYYSYLKNRKGEYLKRRERILDRIKYIYYNVLTPNR